MTELSSRDDLAAPTTTNMVRRNPSLSLIFAGTILALLDLWAGSLGTQPTPVAASIGLAAEATALLAVASIVIRDAFAGCLLTSSAFLLVSVAIRILAPGLAIPSGTAIIGLAWLMVFFTKRESSSWDPSLILLAVVASALRLVTDDALTLMAVAAAVTSALAFATMTSWIRHDPPFKAPVDLASLAAIGIEWLVIVLAIKMALDFASVPATIAAVLIIGSRLHGLFIIYHDAVHGLVASSRRLNDFIINLTIGIPAFAPVHIYRRLHIIHHQHTGTERDPELTVLFADQPWKYEPLPTGQLVGQLLGDLLLVNLVKSSLTLARACLDPQSPLRAKKREFHAELFVGILIWLALIAGLFAYAGAAKAGVVLALVYGPYLTITMLLQKLRSFLEHSHGGNATTNSWHSGLLGRLSLWPYHINYHQEHHRHPYVKWHKLPMRFPSDDFRDAKRVTAEIWQRQSTEATAGQNRHRDIEASIRRNSNR